MTGDDSDKHLSARGLAVLRQTMAGMLLDEQRNEIADRPVSETGMSAADGSLNIS